MAEPIEVSPEDSMKLFAAAKFLCSLISGRPGAAQCRTAAPHVAQVARDLAGRAVVLKVDTERFPELA